MWLIIKVPLLVMSQKANMLLAGRTAAKSVNKSDFDDINFDYIGLCAEKAKQNPKLLNLQI
jgi:hypothetical protein